MDRIAVAVALGFCLVACGCGSDSGGTPIGGNVVNLSGKVQSPSGGTLPNTLTAGIANTNINAPVAPDGSFTLSAVPIGAQTIVIVNSTDPTATPVSAEPVILKVGSNTIPPLPAPANFAPAPNGASGISGIVMEGPITPVQMQGQLNEQPYAGAVLQIDQPDGTFITTVTSDQGGLFAVSIPAGQYEVVPVSGGNGFPHAAPFLVTVKPNQTTSVEVDYDTGIR